MDREEYQDLLRTGPCEVTFTKDNGKERVMKCTLNQDLMPTSVVEKLAENAGAARTVNLDVLPVFDLDKEAWRSFRLDSVTKAVSLA